jgi:Domain of unknown function (DUF4062)
MRVFLSSTLSDLKQYRKVALDTLDTLGVQGINIDQFTANGRISESIIEAIKTADIIVLIVGHRYGAIDSSTGKGWVEKEYELALNLKKPILAFVAREDVSWPPSAIDPDRSKIEEFRASISSRHTVSFFASPQDFATKLATSLIHYMTRESLQPSSRMLNKIREIRIIRLFLSSPGDVSDERVAYAKAIFRFNQEYTEDKGLFIKLIRWEDMAPQIGPGPQNVINSQLGEYDIFSGIMWNRFGTPTDVADSGTEEEFREALSRWVKDKRPWVVFYFSDKPANLRSKEQLAQKAKVIEFREEINKLGLVESFVDEIELEELAYKDLVKITNSLFFKNSILKID